MKVNGIDYPVIGMAKLEKLGCEVPLLDIPMMSDERWMELTNTPEQIELRRKYGIGRAGEFDG